MRRGDLMAGRPPAATTGPAEPRRRPVMLAIAGDSAAGKTTLTAGIVAILGPERVTTVCADDYHRLDRAERSALGITPLHPTCNHIDIIEQHLELLAASQPILKPVYNHAGGTFDPPQYVAPRDFVVVEGLLPLYSRRMRQCFDATVYLDPPEELRRHWKVVRDCAKRGYRPEQVLAEIERREPDAASFIRPQRARADIVVRFERPSCAGNGDSAHLDVRLVLRPTLPHPDLSAFGSTVAGPIRVRLGRDDGKPADLLEIDGDVPDGTAAGLEATMWERMSLAADLGGNVVGAYGEGLESRRSHPLALTQLLLVYHLVAARVTA
ncbi:MAG: phosphoribulokinase [Actinomycetota bacterium]